MSVRINYDGVRDACTNLTTLAGDVNDTCTALNTAVGKIENPAWEGTASTKFREATQKLIDNLPDAKVQMALAVVYLASVADAYEQIDAASIKKLKDLIGGQEYIDNYDVNAAPKVDLDSRYGQEQQNNLSVKEIPVEKEKWQDLIGDQGSYHGNRSGGYYSGTRHTYNSGNGENSSSITTTTALVSAVTSEFTLKELTDTERKGTEAFVLKDTVEKGYTVTGYDYWIDSGEEMKWAHGTKQEKVANIWRELGAVFKDGIAVINVDGVDRYLVAVTPKFGLPGDCIDVVLSDGTIIPCIIGDSKGKDAGHEDGHLRPDGTVNILEFEVQRSKYQNAGNPNTKGWNLPWDDQAKVVSMRNQGSIIGAKKVGNTLQLANTTTEPASATEARESIVKIAESQLNNTNEKEYVAMFGEKTGTPWCSEFVSWCAKKSGYVDAGIIPKFAGAQEGVNWFKKNNQFQDRSYTPQAGDIIFVGGNEPSHTALVTGVKNGKILTIDGNKGDKVLRSSYDLGSRSIYGFGTPDYSKLVKAEETEENKAVAV